MKILLILKRWIVVHEFFRFSVFVLRSAEQGKEDRQANDLSYLQRIIAKKGDSYFDWLDENDGREETTEQGSEPLLTFHIAKLDATDDDEEDRHRRHHH